MADYEDDREEEVKELNDSDFPKNRATL